MKVSLVCQGLQVVKESLDCQEYQAIEEVLAYKGGLEFQVEMEERGTKEMSASWASEDRKESMAYQEDQVHLDPKDLLAHLVEMVLLAFLDEKETRALRELQGRQDSLE